MSRCLWRSLQQPHMYIPYRLKAARGPIPEYNILLKNAVDLQYAGYGFNLIMIFGCIRCTIKGTNKQFRKFGEGSGIYWCLLANLAYACLLTHAVAQKELFDFYCAYQWY